MSSSPLVQPSPLMSFPTMPTPLQHVTSDQGFGMENASASAPQLISHSSSDSSNYAQSSTYSMHNPQTPQLDQSDNTYIPTSAMHIEKHEDLGERSQPHDSPYVSPPQRTYWEGTVDPSAMASAPYNEYGERVKTNDSPYAPPQDQNYWDGAVDAQGMPSQTYGMMPMQYQDQSAHLPHVHAGASQRPSSMDLKVMYPNMQRKPTPP